MTPLEQLQYPIGKFVVPEIYSDKLIAENIAVIENFAENLKKEVAHLDELQLNTTYRENGWTIRQVVHHCADSHMNCFIRIKWTLTENNPVIKFYYEDRWSELKDNLEMDITPSLQLLEGLHYRLSFIMKNLSEIDLDKTFIHPEHNQEIPLKQLIALYAWHCKHHLAHITVLKKSKNWV